MPGYVKDDRRCPRFSDLVSVTAQITSGLQQTRAWKYGFNAITSEQKAEMVRFNVTSPRTFARFVEENPGLVRKLGFDRLEASTRLESLHACAGGYERARAGRFALCQEPLHGQGPVKRFLASNSKLMFLSTTTLGLTWGHEAWHNTTQEAIPRSPSEAIQAMANKSNWPVNNVNNTVRPKLNLAA